MDLFKLSYVHDFKSSDVKRETAQRQFQVPWPWSLGLEGHCLDLYLGLGGLSHGLVSCLGNDVLALKSRQGKIKTFINNNNNNNFLTNNENTRNEMSEEIQSACLKPAKQL